MNTPICILEGSPGAGKTALVRNLAYDLRSKRQTNVFYFKGTDFDPVILAREINHIKGVVIIEDIHIKPEKYQILYSQLNLNPDRHILFTSRPQLSIQKCSTNTDFAKIPCLRLKPFEQADEIIKSFADDHHDPSLSWSPTVYQNIKEISGENFWLLSWALEGYVKKHGAGDPKSWLKERVTAYLYHLEKLNAAFPEVIVALSALYQNEVLTAEKFLVDNLGFDSSVLDMLVGRGEIIYTQTSDGYFLFGLHHSVLAKLYWEYGQ